MINSLTGYFPENQQKTLLSLYTIGYSVRQFKTVVNMLIRHEIEQVIDVRFNDYSANIDFNGQNRDLSSMFRGYGIYYEHRPKLGNPPGIRKLFKDNRKQGVLNIFLVSNQMIEKITNRSSHRKRPP
ncbi:MAG: DUF488 family protein [Candidatus Hodarchaeota archaeon]